MPLAWTLLIFPAQVTLVLRHIRRAALDWKWLPIFIVAFACILTGCATAPKLRGVEDYKSITAQATTEVNLALGALEKVSANADRPTPHLVTSFNESVKRLEVNSQTVRAKAQAIQARGDAYFASWNQNIATIKDPKVRQLAASHHPELLESFSKIKDSSKAAGTAFRPFLSGLVQLRTQLELTQNQPLTAAQKEQVHIIRENGLLVIASLRQINSELANVTQMLTPR